MPNLSNGSDDQANTLHVRASHALAERDRGTIPLLTDAEALKRFLAAYLGLAVNPQDSRVQVEGITFGISPHGQESGIVVYNHCPQCGRELESWGITCLADLGAVLERRPSMWPVCDHGVVDGPESEASWWSADPRDWPPVRAAIRKDRNQVVSKGKYTQ